MTNALDAVMGTLDTLANNDAVKDMSMDAQIGETAVDTAPVLETDTPKDDPKFVHVPFADCPDLLAVLRSKAGTNPLGPFVAQLLCEKYGVTYSKTDGRKRYPEGPEGDKMRAAAIKASQATRAEKVKLLTAQHKAKLAGNTAEVDRIEAILYPKS